MLDLGDFVARLKQVIAWDAHLTQQPVYLNERTDWQYLDRYKQLLQAALAERDAWAAAVESVPKNYLESGRILCVEINTDAAIWSSEWVEDEYGMPPVAMWFALDEFPQDEEAILYCWVPKAFEKLTEQSVNQGLTSGHFWRDKRPNMFYNAVLLAMAESAK